MLIAGRYALSNSPFLQGWQQEYAKAYGVMPPPDKVINFLQSVVNNQSIPLANKQADIRLLEQMQRFGG